MKKKLNLKSVLILLGFLAFDFCLHELMVYFFGVEILNKGISFGMGMNGANVIIGMMLLLIFVLNYFSDGLALAMVFAGGAINLVDRLRFGGVRDYWKIGGWDLYNNINDCLIFAGLVLLVIFELWKKKSK